MAGWIEEQKANIRQKSLMKDADPRSDWSQFLSRHQKVTSGHGLSDIDGPAWDEVRGVLGGVSRSRGRQGFSTSETATFVFTFKEPLFVLRRPNETPRTPG